MILFRLLSWPYVRKHALRTLLTLAGILLGVAVFVGMHTANRSVMVAFNHTVNRIAGKTELQVTAGESGLEERVLDQVQSLSEVRVAVPVVEATAGTGIAGQGNLLILGVDMTGDRSLRDYDMESDDVIDDPLVFLAQPDSIILTSTFVEETHLKLGSKLSMQTMEGPKQFTVRGIMKPGGMTQAFGGNLAVMDVYAAQKVFGRGPRFDRIDLAVKEGLKPEDVRKKLEQLLGPAFQVEPPTARGQQFEALIRAYAITANITSAFALFIGMFIIYNTFQIAVTQRRHEVGILRALGATRGQIRTLFLGESLVLGLVGSLAGALLGLGIARGIAGSIGGLMATVYGVAQKVEQVEIEPLVLGGAMLLGLLTSLIAGWLPARAAAGVDPVRALGKGSAQRIGSRESRVRLIAASGLTAVALGLVIQDRDEGVLVAFALSICVFLLLAPRMSLWFTKLLRPLLRWLRPVEGSLAADSLIQAPRRTSGTVAALMLSVSLVISLGGMARVSYQSIRDWLDNAFNPDLFVTSSEALTDRSFRFPISMAAGLAEVPGVAEVQPVRTPRVVIQGTPVMLISIDMTSISRRIRHKVIEGNSADMFSRAARGEGIVASDNFALQYHYRKGDTVKIPTANGMVSLPILGIIVDYSDQRGSLLLDQALYRKLYHDDTINIFRIYLDHKVAPEQVKRAILDRFSQGKRLFVLGNQDVRKFVLNITDQWFGLTYIQIAVAVLVAILGIVNCLTVSIADRRRELGVLQAVGALRNQVRHTIWMEAISIGALGLMLGYLAGATSLYFSLEISKRQMAGFRLAYEYPVGIALMLIPMLLGAAWISAIGPAESAVRGSLVEALEYE